MAIQADAHGTGVVTMLCGQPDEDPKITPADLDKFRRDAERRNIIQQKTLPPHIAPVEIKREIACHVGTAVTGCD